MPSLDELRKQRALVQQHLEWLDQQIAEQSPDTTSDKTPDSQSSKTPLKLASPQPAPARKPQGTRHPFPELGDESEQLESVQAPTIHNDIAKAKVGCIAIFIAAVSLFLFLLFGLPYLISDSDELQETEQVDKRAK